MKCMKRGEKSKRESSPWVKNMKKTGSKKKGKIPSRKQRKLSSLLATRGKSAIRYKLSMDNDTALNAS